MTSPLDPGPASALLGSNEDNFSQDQKSPSKEAENETPKARRALAYDRQHALNFVLMNYKNSDGVNPFERLNGDVKNYPKMSYCLYRPIPMGLPRVMVRMKSDGKHQARYDGLQTCENPLCPHCSPLRGQVEKQLLQVAIANALQQGYVLIMCTYTLPHYEVESLESVLDILYKSYSQVIGGRRAMILKLNYSLAPHVKHLELTDGDNGYHPHLHCLYAIKETRWKGNKFRIARTKRPLKHRKPIKYTSKNFIALMRSAWLQALKKRGKVGNQHAFDAKIADSAVAEYLNKFGHSPKHTTRLNGWHVENEMTNTHGKVAQKGGKSIMQLLDALNIARHIEQDKPKAFKLMQRIGEIYATLKKRRTVEGVAKFASFFGVEDIPQKRAEIKASLIKPEEEEHEAIKLDTVDLLSLYRKRYRAKFLEIVEDCYDTNKSRQVLFDVLGGCRYEYFKAIKRIRGKPTTPQ